MRRRVDLEEDEDDERAEERGSHDRLHSRRTSTNFVRTSPRNRTTATQMLR